MYLFDIVPAIFAAYTRGPDNRSQFDRTCKLYLSIGKLYKYYCSVLYILLFDMICRISNLKGVFSDFNYSSMFILLMRLERHTAHLLLFDIILLFYDKLLLIFDILTLIIL